MDLPPGKAKRFPVKQLLQLQYEVVEALEKAGTVEDVLDHILAILGRKWNWKKAEFWAVDADAGKIGLERVWLTGAAPGTSVKTQMLARGKGLAGRCWARGKPFWVRGLPPETDFDRPPASANLALESAFALPMAAEGNTLGALLFFLEPSDRPGRSLRNFLASLGSQLAQFLRQRQAEKQARNLSVRLLYAQEAERRRIASKLHESTAQDLAALKLNLDLVKGHEGNIGDEAKHALREGLALLEKTIQDVRTLAYILHPPELDALGLAKALDTYAKGFSRRSGIQVDLTLPEALDPLPRELRTAIFRIVQESLTNIHQHAGGSHARIELERLPNRLHLEIRDYGRGMPERTPQGQHLAITAMGVGTSGMQERARQLGGRLEIASGKKGTTVRAVFPLKDDGN